MTSEEQRIVKGAQKVEPRAMNKPTKVKVEKWGDGWKPLPGQCPWERDEPDYFRPENFLGTNFCMNSQATSACECHLYTASEGVCICMYVMTEDKKMPYWDRMREYAERKAPMQGSLFPELETEGVEIPGIPPCKSCGSTYFERKSKGPHKGVYCANCGKWQRWEAKEIIHDSDWVVPKGQYKGRPLRKVPTDYMRKSIQNCKKTGMTRRFCLELQDRQAHFCQMMYDAFCAEADGRKQTDFDKVMARIAIKTGLPENYVRKTFWLVLDDEFVDGDGRKGYLISLDEDTGFLSVVDDRYGVSHTHQSP